MADVGAAQQNDGMCPTDVVVKYIYELYVFSHSVAKSSAECSRCSPISSLV